MYLFHFVLSFPSLRINYYLDGFNGTLIPTYICLSLWHHQLLLHHNVVINFFFPLSPPPFFFCACNNNKIIVVVVVVEELLSFFFFFFFFWTTVHFLVTTNTAVQARRTTPTPERLTVRPRLTPFSLLLHHHAPWKRNGIWAWTLPISYHWWCRLGFSNRCGWGLHLARGERSEELPSWGKNVWQSYGNKIPSSCSGWAICKLGRSV